MVEDHDLEFNRYQIRKDALNAVSEEVRHENSRLEGRFPSQQPDETIERDRYILSNYSENRPQLSDEELAKRIRKYF
jgi:hypothetical protein